MQPVFIHCEAPNVQYDEQVVDGAGLQEGSLDGTRREESAGEVCAHTCGETRFASRSGVDCTRDERSDADAEGGAQGTGGRQKHVRLPRSRLSAAHRCAQ